MYIDFETRSECDIRKSGADAYARHPSTRVICLAYSYKGETPTVYIPEDEYTRHGRPDITTYAITHTPPERNPEDTVTAHNAPFDAAIWNNCLDTHLPPEVLDCTMARALAMAMPASLGALGEALDITMPKNPMGTRLINEMCKPPFKASPELLTNMVEYCARDVEALIEVDKLLIPLRPEERDVWIANYRANARGLCLDQDLINACITLADEEDLWIIDYAASLAPGVNLRSTKQVIEWLACEGVHVPNLEKRTLLTTKMPERICEVLKLREQLCSNSVKKFGKMLDVLCEDGRARGNHVYHKATTGRFAGSGIQVQNLPRPAIPATDKVAEYVVENQELPHYVTVDTKTALKSLLRSAIVSAEGHELFCADYSSIESRVLFWLAGDSKGLGVYASGKDLYCVTAEAIFGHPVNKDDHPFERSIGKVAVLSLGYQGGPKAFKGMCEAMGVDIGDLDPDTIVKGYRDAYSTTKQFWYNCEEAAKVALVNVGTTVPCGKVRFKYSTKINALVCKLPSGRLIHWPRAEIDPNGTTPWGAQTDKIVYMGVGINNKWQRTETYGGDIAQSITQATARDLLCHALVKMDKAGLHPVLHVHDEIMVEESTDRYQDFQNMMTFAPDWAYGLPIAIGSWRARRYQK